MVTRHVEEPLELAEVPPLPYKSSSTSRCQKVRMSYPSDCGRNPCQISRDVMGFFFHKSKLPRIAPTESLKHGQYTLTPLAKTMAQVTRTPDRYTCRGLPCPPPHPLKLLSPSATKLGRYVLHKDGRYAGNNIALEHVKQRRAHVDTQHLGRHVLVFDALC